MSQEIYEAFQELQGLDEATFSFDRPGMLGLQQFLDDNDYSDEEITLIDIDAEEDEDIDINDHDGDVTLECCVCGCKSLFNPKDVIIDQETQLANVGQECPCCLNTDGYKIVGEFDVPEEEQAEKNDSEEDDIEYIYDSSVDTEEDSDEEEFDEEEIEVEDTEEDKDDKLTEAKEPEDLWYQVYDTLENAGKSHLYKKGGNKLDDMSQKAARIAVHSTGNGIVVNAESEEDLSRVKSILDGFAADGVTYNVSKDRFGEKKLNQYKAKLGDRYTTLDLSRYYPYIIDVSIPEIEPMNEDFNPDTITKIKEEDIINFDEETGDLETSFEYFPEDVKPGDRFTIEFIDEEEENEHPVRVAFAFKEKTKYGTVVLEFVDVYDNIPVEEPEEDENNELNESFEGADIIIEDKDIKSIDDTTFEVVLTWEASREIDSEDYSDIVSVGFASDKDENIYTYDMYTEDEEGCIHMKLIGRNKPTNMLKESIENISVETDSDTINVKPSENGAVTVEAQPKDLGNPEDATIVPVSDEVKAEIESNSEPEEEEVESEEEEETEENTSEDEGGEENEAGENEEDVEVSDLDEETFDELGESYLKNVYNNVKSFKTTKGYINEDKIKLEGIITFTSGKKSKTSFLFESSHVSNRGKYKFLGENLQITNRKKAFILTGNIKNGKLISESLSYNYNAKDANTGKLQRVYGTVRKTK